MKLKIGLILAFVFLSQCNEDSNQSFTFESKKLKILYINKEFKPKNNFIYGKLVVENLTDDTLLYSNENLFFQDKSVGPASGRRAHIASYTSHSIDFSCQKLKPKEILNLDVYFHVDWFLDEILNNFEIHYINNCIKEYETKETEQQNIQE